jgi:hypothetical protein
MYIGGSLSTIAKREGRLKYTLVEIFLMRGELLFMEIIVLVIVLIFIYAALIAILSEIKK